MEFGADFSAELFAARWIGLSLDKDVLMSVAEAVAPVVEHVEPLIVAVRTLDKAFARWWKLKDDLDFPPELVSAISVVCSLVTTSFPKDDRLMDLYLCCLKLANAFQSVIEEEPNSERLVIGAIELVVKNLDAIDQEEEAPQQSVQSMLSEWKNSSQKYLWVARAFGSYDAEEDTWEGPFFTRGIPDQRKIDRESENPGTVLGNGFQPKSSQLKAARIKADAMKQLANLQAGLFRPEGGAKPEKATVLELLRDGQYPDVISRIKGVSVNEVLAVAKEYGIAVSTRETDLGAAALESSSNPIAEARGYVKPSFDDADDLPDDDDQPFDVDATIDAVDEPERVSSKISTQELEDFTLSFLAENNDATMHEILGAAVTQTGKDVSRQMLAPILKKLRG